MKSAATAVPNVALKDARERRGWSQERVAEHVGTDAFTVCRWERGLTSPGPHNREQLCALFGLSADELGLRSRASGDGRGGDGRGGPPDHGAATPLSAPASTWPLALPAAVTPLVGRERDVRAAIDLLRHGDVRLLMLHGPGGVGKTRLGLQIAAEVGMDFAGGVRVVPLAAVRDAARVPPAIVEGLGLQRDRDHDSLALLRDHLRATSPLLLLDNFEQVVAAAPMLLDLLRACPDLKIIVTSRTALDVRGEQRFPVEPLEVPGPEDVAPDAVALAASVRLFLQRARMVVPAFALTAANAAAIAAICRQTDGLPLAIEIAAAQIRLLPPRALARSLRDGFALDMEGAHDLPERQRTMRRAIAWSYALLTPAQQILFRGLAVFAGGAALDAVRTVCVRAPSDVRVPRDLFALLDHALVTRYPDTEDEVRVGMLEVVHEYARERLEESREIDAAARAHALWHLELAERADGGLRGHEQGQWLARLERAHANFRGALGWAIDRGESAIALRLAGALAWFWYVRGHFGEGRAWLERALALDDRPPPDEPEVSLAPHRARALHGAGMLAHYQGDFQRAKAYYQECLTARRGLGDMRAIAHTLNNLGLACVQLCDFAEAAALFAESLEIKQSLGDARGVASTLANLATARYAQDDLAGAARIYVESLKRWRMLGDTQSIARTLANLGSVTLEQGDDSEAARLLDESLRLRRELADKRGIAHTSHLLGDLALARGDAGRALALYRETLDLCQDLGDRASAVRALEAVAALWHTRGQSDRAVRLLVAAATYRDAYSLRLDPRAQAGVEGTLAAARGALDTATFAAAWEAGTALSLDEVLVEAAADAYGADGLASSTVLQDG